METVHVGLPVGAYDIRIGSLVESEPILASILEKRQVLVISDSNTVDVASELFTLLDKKNVNYHSIDFPAGEASKTFESAAKLCGAAANLGCDRTSIIIAVGGGVVGDLAGFVAAIYMRGIDFIQVPTSLLAMVDSSVGGKTAVDIPEGKNLAGAFHQPRLVLIEPKYLKTLPKRELVGAMAEVIKYGVIFDVDFFAFLENNVVALQGNSFDNQLYSEVIRKSCEWKAQVVIEDEKEKGKRALLNYGHTFGHAIEMLTDFKINHGEAVALGMVIAGELACLLGRWSSEENKRQRQLLLNIGLPVTLDQKICSKEMLEFMKRDKKSIAGNLRLILPSCIGKADIVTDVPIEQVLKAIEVIHD